MSRRSLPVFGVGVVAIFLCMLNLANFFQSSKHLYGSTDGAAAMEQMALELVAVKKLLESERNKTNELLKKNHQQSTDATTKPTQIESDVLSGSNNDVCSLLPRPIPSTMALWSGMLGNIIQATKHERDLSKFVLFDFYAHILHMLPPDRMQRSVKSIPHDWAPIKQILDVGYKRWRFLQNGNVQGQQEPRRIKVVVLGGSVMVGVQCRTMPFPYRMPRKECMWTYRLQRFLNNILGGDVVETHNLALGGTNSETGYRLWKYDLLPEEMKDPDIVINAYSTNDMHILTVRDAEKGDQTLRDKVLEMIQQFVRAVMEPDPCKNNTSPPLYIHMDDYLGNEQREILETTMLSQSVNVLANYYGFLSISYADVLRDLVYGDTRETWFSPRGWYNTETGEFEREIHPGMAMHIASTWLIAYNMLNLVISYCSIEWTQGSSQQPSNETIAYIPFHGLPELKHTNRWVPDGKPRPRPPGLPPVLDKGLLLERVSELWRNLSIQDSSAKTCRAGTDSRCVFSWISGLALSKDMETQLEAKWFNHTIENNGWRFRDDHDKLGFVPERLSSHFVMEFSNLTQPIHTMTLMIMKSYGESWNNSRITVNASVGRNPNEWLNLISVDYVGYHNKNTSETYTYEVPLKDYEIHPGNNLRLRMELAAGTTFKVMGLALCI